MRRDGLWHPRLLEIVAGLGHTELLVVADAGLPIPPAVERLDLVWARDEPRFLPVVRVLVQECVIEGATIAAELEDARIRSGLTDALGGAACSTVPHEQLKAMTSRARAVVRTGETTPYANVVLRAGVAF